MEVKLQNNLFHFGDGITFSLDLTDALCTSHMIYDEAHAWL